MFIWESDSGDVTYTGSFNKAEWETYWAERGEKPRSVDGPGGRYAPDEIADTDDEEVGADEAPTDSSDEPKRPAQSDPKGAWVDFAVYHGIDRGEAETMTKADLIELLKEDDHDGNDNSS